MSEMCSTEHCHRKSISNYGRCPIHQIAFLSARIATLEGERDEWKEATKIANETIVEAIRQRDEAHSGQDLQMWKERHAALEAERDGLQKKVNGYRVRCDNLAWDGQKAEDDLDEALRLLREAVEHTHEHTHDIGALCQFCRRVRDRFPKEGGG